MNQAVVSTNLLRVVSYLESSTKRRLFRDVVQVVNMSRSRNAVPKPFEGYPAYGAAHGVVPSDQLRGFLYDSSRIADYVFMHGMAGVSVDPVEFSNHGQKSELTVPSDVRGRAEENGYDPRTFYRVFDPETLGVTVVEMDASEKAARTVRKVWERHDFGAVEQEVKTEVGRSTSNLAPRLFFNHADTVGKRLPGSEIRNIRQKVALFPEAFHSQDTLELLEHESDVVFRAINRRLKQFMKPWDTTPHVTYQLFRDAAKAREVEVIMETTNNYLQKFPFAARLDLLALRHKSVRGKKYSR